jgi:hypothetical protein
MAYTKTAWQVGRAGGTEFTAARMNNIEQGIADAHAGLIDGITGVDASAYAAGHRALLMGIPTRDAIGYSATASTPRLVWWTNYDPTQNLLVDATKPAWRMKLQDGASDRLIVERAVATAGAPTWTPMFNVSKDAIAPRAKRMDFNGTTWDVTGLDGNTHIGYDITVWGIYGATSGENASYLTTLTPLTNYTKSVATENAVDAANTASGTLTDTSRIGVGVFLGATVDAPSGRNIGIIKLSVGAATPSSGNNDYPVMGQALWRPANRPAGTPGHRMVMIGGFLEAPAGNLTALQFHWDNAAFVGSVLIEPWVGSF